MKNWALLILVFFVHLAFKIPAQENNHVLFISSYNAQFPTYTQQISGIKSITDTANINLDIEFMDSKRFADTKSTDLFYKFLKNKIKNTTEYNVIITADDNAFNFALQYGDELFKDIPIVFFGVNNHEKAQQQNSNPQVTGVVESVSMKETIDLMINLFPETGEIYCITDSTSSGLADLKRYRQISKQIPNTNFQEIILSQFTFSEYEDILNAIPYNAPVLLLSAYHDKTHNSIDFNQTIHLLKKNLHAPLFHLWEHGIGKGMIGGKVISHFEQGKTAAEITHQILSGRPPSTIKIVDKIENIFMFDYNQLVKYKITLEKIPYNSIIINQPITFWKRHRQVIIISLAILLALFVLVLVLTGNIIKRKKIESQLKIQNSNILELNNDLLIAKLKAEEGEEKFKQLFYNHAAIKLLIRADSGQIFDANPAAISFYGWRLDELCKMNINDISTRFLSKLKKHSASSPKSEKDHIELEHKKADGTIADVEVFYSSVYISKKKYFYLIIHDISEKKKQEHRISLLSRSVEQSPEAINITDKNGIIQYVNPAFTKISGFSEREAIGQNPRILKSGKTPKKVYKDLWKTIKAGKTWQGELENKKANGDFYWVEKSISPIFENNELTNFVSISEDITEKRKIIEDLVIAKEKAQESDRLKSAFLANMSHEIRTPMNGILGFSSLLKSSKLSGEEQKEYIQIIEKSGIRMLNIINDIIRISQIESGIIDVNLSETNINNQLLFVYNSLKLDAANKKLNLLFSCAPFPKETIIKTDEEKFYSILSNLVKNAIKYTNKGSIEFGYVNKEKEIEFYVKDTGIGIPQEKIDVIFERFIQADITNKMATQGAGLGLAISKAYVEVLGGKIWVKSEESKGSTFFFTLPRHKNSEENN